MVSALSAEQVRRYARHILLPDVGGVGQRRLLGATVAVEVVDGDASALCALAYLAAAGVGTLLVTGRPRDPVTARDVAGGVLLGSEDIGRERISAIAERIRAINPDVTVCAADPGEPVAGAVWLAELDAAADAAADADADDADADAAADAAADADDADADADAAATRFARGVGVADALALGGRRAARTLALVLGPRQAGSPAGAPAIVIPSPSVLDLVGNTPLIRLRSVEARAGGGVEIWAKCEFANPGGSVKDRAARQIILDALADGRLAPGKILIDSTSGNTGVAYAMIGAALGIEVHLVMPKNVSVARKNITRAYGTRIIYSSELEGSDGAIRLVQELVAEHPERYFFPNQYANPSNVRAHYLGTGAEILDALGDRITHFVAGVGTTGTVMGTGMRLKEAGRPIEVVAVEPDDEFHGLEGLKHLPSSIVPAIWQPRGIIDRTLRMGTDEGWEASELLVEHEGLFVGHSAGANVAAACRVAAEAGPGAVVVTILPDRGDRYFQPMKWEQCHVW